jgi:hypothetical protein
VFLPQSFQFNREFGFFLFAQIPIHRLICRHFRAPVARRGLWSRRAARARPTIEQGRLVLRLCSLHRRQTKFPLAVAHKRVTILSSKLR